SPQCILRRSQLLRGEVPRGVRCRPQDRQVLQSDGDQRQSRYERCARRGDRSRFHRTGNVRDRKRSQDPRCVFEPGRQTLTRSARRKSTGDGAEACFTIALGLIRRPCVSGGWLYSADIGFFATVQPSVSPRFCFFSHASNGRKYSIIAEASILLSPVITLSASGQGFDWPSASMACSLAPASFDP